MAYPDSEYANEEPIGGTGNEVAVAPPQPFNQGFMYIGSPGGEAAAREQFAAEPQLAQTPGDRFWESNAALGARMRAEQAAGDAERFFREQVEQSYRQQTNKQQERVIQAAQDHLERMNTERDMQAGMPPHLAYLKNHQSSRNTAAIVNALTPPQAYNIPGIGLVLNKGKFPPRPEATTPTGAVQAEPALDSAGNPISGINVFRGARGALHFQKENLPPELSGTMDISGTKVHGKLSQLQNLAGTNMPALLRPPAPQPAGNITIGGLPTGAIQAGDVSIQPQNSAPVPLKESGVPAKDQPYDSLEDAKKAGMKTGDVILLWNPHKNKYSRFKID